MSRSPSPYAAILRPTIWLAYQVPILHYILSDGQAGRDPSKRPFLRHSTLLLRAGVCNPASGSSQYCSFVYISQNPQSVRTAAVLPRIRRASSCCCCCLLLLLLYRYIFKSTVTTRTSPSSPSQTAVKSTYSCGNVGSLFESVLSSRPAAWQPSLPSLFPNPNPDTAAGMPMVAFPMPSQSFQLRQSAVAVAVAPWRWRWHGTHGTAHHRPLL